MSNRPVRKSISSGCQIGYRATLEIDQAPRATPKKKKKKNKVTNHVLAAVQGQAGCGHKRDGCCDRSNAPFPATTDYLLWRSVGVSNVFQFVSTDLPRSNDFAYPLLVISGRNGRPLLLLRRVSPRCPPIPSQLTSPISFGRIVCRDRFSTAARIGIAVASFVVIFAILLAYSMYRRRRAARTNIALVHAPQNQQQGYPDQYPPPPQGGFTGTPPGGNGQKVQQGYDPQLYNGQYNPQYNDQHGPQYNGQYNQPYNAPQYPPAAYDQGQPVSTVPISGCTFLSSPSRRCHRTLGMGRRLALPLSSLETPITCRKPVWLYALYHSPPCVSPSTVILRYTPQNS